MATELINALNLDGNLTNKFISICGQNTDANFVISCLLSKTVRDRVCLVTFGQLFSHYHNVGVKFGYNLKEQQQNNQLETIDMLQMTSEAMTNVELIDQLTSKQVHTQIRDKLRKLTDKNSTDRIYVIVDDLTYLLDLNEPVRHVLTLVQYLNDLRRDENVCVICGTSNPNGGYLGSNAITRTLDRIADVSVVVDALKTGHSRDVSGVIRVKSRMEDDRKFLYKLYDRKVDVFALGAFS